MKDKKTFFRVAAGWVGLFTILVMIPLFLARIGHQEANRGFWIEFGAGLGFIGLAMLWLQFAISGRFKNIAHSLGTDNILNFHRQAGYNAYFFILAHFTVLFIAEPDFLAFLDPTVQLPRAVALGTVIIVLTLLVSLTVWREELSLSYEWWRITHGVFGFLILFIGLVHIIQVGFYITDFWQQFTWTAITGAAMASLLYVRVWRPLKMKKKPYRIRKVWEETNEIWTISIEPEGHDGVRFKAGQFAWLTIGETPFSLQQHPFSFSSSEDKAPDYQFAIKELGDFTSTVKHLEENTKVFLEGPYGAFTLPPESSGVYFVVGGIGITPVVSMLRTLRDHNDQRPLTLLYGNPDIESIPFKEEIEKIKMQLNLRVVHVLGNPPEEWNGESGFIDKEILERYLHEDMNETDYYICGPEPMMNAAETGLKDLGVPIHKLRSERFAIV